MDIRNYEFDGVTGLPLVGAAVTVYTATLSHPPITAEGSGVTNGDGLWSFTGLTSGAKDVKVVANGQTKWYKGMTRHTLGEVMFTETMNVNGLATFTGGANFSGGTTFATQPTITSVSKAQAHLGSDQALTDSVWNTILMDTEDEDILGEYNPATYSFTPQVSGTYLVCAGVTVAGTVPSQRTIMALWNATNAVANMCDGGVILAQATIIIPLIAGTSYVLRVFPVYAGGDAMSGAAGTYIQYLRIR